MKNSLKLFLLTIVLLPLNSLASFQDGFLSTPDVIKNVYFKFKKISLTDGTLGHCQVVSSSEEGSMGYHSPVNGDVSSRQPGVPFLNWHRACVNMYLDKMTYPDVSGQQKKIDQLTEEIYFVLWDKINLSNGAKLNENLLRLQIGTLSENLLQDHVNHVIEWCLGSDDEIIYYGKIYNMAAFKQGLAQEMRHFQTVENGTRNLIVKLLARDEFLMY